MADFDTIKVPNSKQLSRQLSGPGTLQALYLSKQKRKKKTS